MRKRFALLATLFVVFVGQSTLGGRAQKRQQLVGTVVGYDQLLSLTNITSAPQLQVLIVRLRRQNRRADGLRYVKVMYRYVQGKTALPDRLFDENEKWFFIMKRDRSCDSLWHDLKTQTVQGAMPRYKFGKELENIPDDTSLPCYTLLPGGLRQPGDRH